MADSRPASAIFDEVHDAGGYTQINHPTIFPSQIPLLAAFCRGCPWDYTPQQTDYAKVDAIEVQTGPPGADEPPVGPNPFTPLAVAFWDEAIDDGGSNSNRIAALGSSDAHNGGDQGEGPDALLSSPIGEATTMVYADELSEQGVADAVRASHTYVKPFGQDGPDLRLEGVEPGSGDPPAIFGDSLESETGFSATLRFQFQNLNQARAARPGTYVAVVFRNADVLLSVPIPPTGESFEFEIPTLGYARYRVQVQRESAIEAISSPIYVDPAGGDDPPDPPSPPTRCQDAPKLRLTDGDDTFVGTSAPDRASGAKGQDRLRGRDGADCLAGQGGRDIVVGGRGADRLKGGAGNDRLRARDGIRDLVACGRGRDDRAVVDRIDRVRRCERVRLPR